MNDNELYHYGILGMKWGVRRFQNKDGSLTNDGKKRYSIGNGLTLEERKLSKFANFLGKHIKSVREEQKKSTSYDIKVGKKKVGDLDLYQESYDSININWIGINAKERGKHYASTVMHWVVKSSAEKGMSQLTLEVPTSSPDARHIYEKYGFKEVGKVSDNDDVWDGLTAMKLKLK